MIMKYNDDAMTSLKQVSVNGKVPKKLILPAGSQDAFGALWGFPIRRANNAADSHGSPIPRFFPL